MPRISCNRNNFQNLPRVTYKLLPLEDYIKPSFDDIPYHKLVFKDRLAIQFTASLIRNANKQEDNRNKFGLCIPGLYENLNPVFDIGLPNSDHSLIGVYGIVISKPRRLTSIESAINLLGHINRINHVKQIFLGDVSHLFIYPNEFPTLDPEPINDSRDAIDAMMYALAGAGLAGANAGRKFRELVKTVGIAKITSTMKGHFPKKIVPYKLSVKTKNKRILKTFKKLNHDKPKQSLF